MHLSDVIRDSKVCTNSGEMWFRVSFDQFKWLIDEHENMENKLYQAEADLLEFKQAF